MLQCRPFASLKSRSSAGRLPAWSLAPVPANLRTKRLVTSPRSLVSPSRVPNYSRSESKTGNTLDIICQSEPVPACLTRVRRFAFIHPSGLWTSLDHSRAEPRMLFFSLFSLRARRGCCWRPLLCMRLAITPTKWLIEFSSSRWIKSAMESDDFNFVTNLAMATLDFSDFFPLGAIFSLPCNLM